MAMIADVMQFVNPTVDDLCSMQVKTFEVFCSVEDIQSSISMSM